MRSMTGLDGRSVVIPVITQRTRPVASVKSMMGKDTSPVGIPVIIQRQRPAVWEKYSRAGLNVIIQVN